MIQQLSAAAQLFAGRSEMAQLMRSYDWSATPLGPVEQWSQSLKTSVRIMLTSRQPMFVWWGKELINLYNDAYKAIVGGKHPEALGQPASVVWQEIWEQVRPRAESAMLKNEGTYDEALLLIMERNGYPEETYYTFSYSPIPDDQNNTSGIICANTDDTRRIVGERQLALLRELAATTADARTFNQACTLSARCLETNPYDFPFAMIYLVDPEQQCAYLAGTCGIERSHPAVPEMVDLTADSPWAFAQVLKTHQFCLISDLAASFGDLPTGAWSQTPDQAIAVPLAPSGQTGKAGILIAGLNPFRLFDNSYQGFIDLVAAQISASIANAQAYEEERKRVEALAELDRAKTTFFSNVSHEFRTPLTLMLSPLEELANTLENRLQPEERDQLQLIQRNGLRLQKLVNMLLDFSRIEAGRVQALYEATDLASFTAELASVFRSLIERAGMTLQIDCPPLPNLVYVDREMWEKIVLNLISNAFKFTFSGSITVRLQAVNDQVEFSVADTGVGIPDAELPRLFERFHRVSGTRSRTYEGSGIGLALVQELVKLHGGTIGVTSQLEQGTTFTIALPFGLNHLPDDRIEAARAVASTALGANPYVVEAWRWLPETEITNQELGEDTSLPNPQPPVASTATARILLADDNADMRDYVKRLLSQYWVVETVSDGLAAWDAIARTLPDLVLSDVMMPKLDGFGLLRALRADPRTTQIPVILLSARAGEESRIEGLAAGADDYLTKPFSARELLARVESNLKLAQLRKAAAQQEQALRLEVQAAKDTLESVLARVADQFLALDREWRYTYVSDRVVEVSGISRENLLGKSAWEVFPDTVGSQFYVEVHRAVAEQIPVQFEYFYPGWNRWFENRVYPSADGVSIITSEITARKQAEAALRQQEIALRESEDRFRNMADNAPMMVWVTDSTGYCTYLSQSWYGFTGQTEATGLGAGWLNVVHPDDQGFSKSLFLAANEQQKAFQLEYRLQRKDGEYRWVIDAATAWFGVEGEFKGFIGSVIDITDRKQAEADLQQSEERYRSLAEMIPQLVWTANPDGVLIDINQRWSDFTGLTLQQAQVEGWEAVIHPDDLQTLQQNWAVAQQAGSHYRAEGRMRRTDGVYCWHLHGAVPLKNAQGQILKWFGTATDIEAQKQLEHQRQELLKREQVAREQAETANRLKDEFLAVLSHELRSPLNPILGWASLLQRGRLNAAKTTQALETIDRNAKLQAQLIDDLLDISRILRGKLSLTIEPVDLGTVIIAALETVRLAAKAKSLTIQPAIAPAVGWVNGDAGRLQQVVWNLLSNAVKFTPIEGKISVELTQVATYAQIQVKDSGKGIHPDFLPYVFEHFRQEDAATTRKFGGLGLGLAIVRQIVEMHGGTVRVESPGEGQGATFTVQIPLASGLLDLPVASQVCESTLHLNGIQVLVVDDDADSRDFIAFVLEQAGAQVRSVASGLDALQQMAESSPDVIISDIGMPDMDGYMLMQQIRARFEAAGAVAGRDYAGPAAIALTAYAGEINQQQALAAGFQQHIAKPVEPITLIEAIATLNNNFQEN